MIEVGHSVRTRPWQSHAFANPPEGVRYRRAVDVPNYRLVKSNAFLMHTRLFADPRRFDFFHTYNCIVANRRPWIIEVESVVPRYFVPETNWSWRYGIRRLRSSDCRAIVFTSHFAKSLNAGLIASEDIDPAKLHVIYRAVATHKRINRSDELRRFLFVGNAFYRKGGIDLLRAFRSIKNPAMRLTIVSNFEIDYRINPTQDEIVWVRSAIDADDRIEEKANLSHAGVIDEMRRHDVFVMPTYHDAFNNTILEAMGCGLPIIASSVVSVPEMIADGENGILLPDPNSRAMDDVHSDIAEALNAVVSNNSEYQRKSKASHQIIERKFSLSARNAALRQIFSS